MTCHLTDEYTAENESLCTIEGQRGVSLSHDVYVVTQDRRAAHQMNMQVYYWLTLLSCGILCCFTVFVKKQGKSVLFTEH